MRVEPEPAGTHYREVFRFVRRRVGSEADAEDVTQDVFATAAEALARSPESASPTLAWLYTVAKRRLADRARRQRLETVPLELVLDPATDDDPYGDRVARTFDAALRSMPPAQRDVVVPRLLEGRSSPRSRADSAAGGRLPDAPHAWPRAPAGRVREGGTDAMSRTRSAFDDRELVELLAGEPELLAIADALVVTLGPEYTAHRQAAALRRRAKRLAPLAATLAAVVALLLVAPWQRGPSLVENALAAVGDGPVLYVVVEQPAPEESLRDLSTGKVIPRNVRTEIWFDGGRDLKKTLMTLDGAVLDEVLETRQGGWTRGGRVYTCAWIAAHPVEATKARVSCDPSGENGTTPRTVPERPPTVDLALGGFVDRYRSALATGAATKVGEGTVNGREVVWLRIPTPGGDERVAIDAATYAPVRIDAGHGADPLRVVTAQTLPFDPARFAKPAPVPAQLGGGTSSETPLDVDRGSEILGAPAVWLGRDWNGLHSSPSRSGARDPHDCRRDRKTSADREALLREGRGRRNGRRPADARALRDDDVPDPRRLDVLAARPDVAEHDRTADGRSVRAAPPRRSLPLDVARPERRISELARRPRAVRPVGS